MFNLKDWDATRSLNRARRKPSPGAPTREPPANDADAPQRSRATDHHIQTFIDAQQNGDHAEQGYIFNNIVNAWRADNAAGGLPVYAHPPLPEIFADHLATTIKQLPETDQKAHLEGITANLEPGTRLSVLQQLGHAMTSADTALFEPHAPAPWIQPPDATPPAERMGLAEGLHIPNSQTTDPHLKSLIASLIQDHIAQGSEDVAGINRVGSTDLKLQVTDLAEEHPSAVTVASRPSDPNGLQTLEFRPEVQPDSLEPITYTDDDGKKVPTANPLSNGAIPPPRPAYNKVLPIQSAVATKDHPQKGYSSGEYDPTAIGLRFGRDKRTGRYGPKRHDGIDFYAHYGEPARVAADGVVVAVIHSRDGYGTHVAVRHADGTMTMYAHLDPRSVRVSPGQFIRVGTILGGAGVSGNASRPQVHFEVWRQAYTLPGGGLDYTRGHSNLIDPYEWYDAPMPSPPPRPKPAWP